MNDFSSPIRKNKDNQKDKIEQNKEEYSEDFAELQKQAAKKQVSRKKYQLQDEQKKREEHAKLEHYAKIQSTKQKFNFDNIKLIFKILIALIILFSFVLLLYTFIAKNMNKSLKIEDIEQNLTSLNFKASVEMGAKSDNPQIIFNDDGSYILVRYKVDKGSTMNNGRKTRRDCKVTLKINVNNDILDLNPEVAKGTLIKCQPKKLPKVNF